MILFIVTVCNSLFIVTRLNYGNDYEKASPFCGMEREEDENEEDDEKGEEGEDDDKEKKVVEEGKEGNKDDDGEEGHKREDAHHIVH